MPASQRAAARSRFEHKSSFLCLDPRKKRTAGLDTLFINVQVHDANEHTVSSEKKPGLETHDADPSFCKAQLETYFYNVSNSTQHPVNSKDMFVALARRLPISVRNAQNCGVCIWPRVLFFARRGSPNPESKQQGGVSRKAWSTSSCAWPSPSGPKRE